MRSLPKRERCIIVTPLSRSGKPCRRSSVIGLPGRGCRRGKDVGRVGSFRVRILCSDCQKIRNRGFLSQTLAPPHIGPTEVPQKNGSVRNTRNTREWMADGITIIRGSHTDNGLRVSETRVVLYYNTLGGGSRL